MECRGGSVSAAFFAFWAFRFEMLITSATMTEHFNPIPTDRIALAAESLSRSAGPVALVLIVKIYLHFLVRQALVGEPSPGERLSLGEFASCPGGCWSFTVELGLLETLDVTSELSHGLVREPAPLAFVFTVLPENVGFGLRFRQSFNVGKINFFVATVR